MLGQHGRRQMEVQLVVALELVAELLQERAVGVEPSDLVLVLVGQQLEVVAGDRFGQAGETTGALAPRSARTRRPGSRSGRHRRRSGSRSGSATPARDHLVQGLRQRALRAVAAGAAVALTAARSTAARRPQRKAPCSSRPRRRSTRSPARSLPRRPGSGPSDRRAQHEQVGRDGSRPSAPWRCRVASMKSRLGAAARLRDRPPAARSAGNCEIRVRG